MVYLVMVLMVYLVMVMVICYVMVLCILCVVGCIWPRNFGWLGLVVGGPRLG
jgi:hypothetical protein